MSLYIASLNSGSNGNCYYIGNGQEAVLVDAGISCRETEKRMHTLGLDPRRLKAIFITHEHTDHISGLQGLWKKYRVPVYISLDTYRASGLVIDAGSLNFFSGLQAIPVGGLRVTPFHKWHDAADPYSLVISCGGVTAGVFTDIGLPCSQVIHFFSQCHAVFLEANYDAAMLAGGRYPMALQNRIRGGRGHLSNAQALELFLRHRPSFMTHVLLSHLSRENNNPELAMALFNGHAGGVQVIHAPRNRATALYQIHSTGQSLPRPPAQKARPAQLSLFAAGERL